MEIMYSAGQYDVTDVTGQRTENGISRIECKRTSLPKKQEILDKNSKLEKPCEDGIAGTGRVLSYVVGRLWQKRGRLRVLFFCCLSFVAAGDARCRVNRHRSDSAVYCDRKIF